MENKKTYEEQLNDDLSVYYDEKTELNKNKDFAQINVNYQAELMQLAITEPLSMTIFMLFISRMERNNTYIITKQELADCVFKSVRSIDRAIKKLIENNFLIIIKFNRSNVYFINPNISCSCSAYHKKRLIKEYSKLSQHSTKADNSIINLSAIVESKSRLVLKTNFYKQHKELQKPEMIDIMQELDYLEILNNMPRHKLLELKEQYATETITKEEQQQLTENIERKQKTYELLKAERKLDEQIENEKWAKSRRENQSKSEPDLQFPPEGFGPTEIKRF